MKKNQIIAKALKEIARGIETLAEAYLIEEELTPVQVADPIADAPVEKPKKEAKKEEAKVVEIPEEIEEVETDEEGEDLEISDLDVEDLQLIAKQMKLRGYKNLEKEDLVEKLVTSDETKLMTALEELGYLDVEDSAEEIKEEIIHEAKVKTGEVIPEIPEAIDEEEEDVPLSFDLEELDEVELKGLCKILGISTRGKKQALITRIYTVEESEVDEAYDTLMKSTVEPIEDEEEEEVVETPKKKAKAKAKPVEREVMTKARAKVMQELPEVIDEEIKDGNITIDTMYEVLESLGRVEEDETDEVVKDKYAQLLIDLTDDEGDNHDFEEAYFVNDELRCCGVDIPVKDDEGICPVCETHYELA